MSMLTIGGFVVFNAVLIGMIFVKELSSSKHNIKNLKMILKKNRPSVDDPSDQSC